MALPAKKACCVAILYLAGLTFETGNASGQSEAPPRVPAEEVARAEAECAQAVSRGCLLVLALDAATEDFTRHSRLISHLAENLAQLGDREGALRSLKFSPAPPTAEELLALGRWDEAYELASKSFDRMAVKFGTAEGSFKQQMVRAQLEQGELNRALQTAHSIGRAYNEDDKALKLIVSHLIKQSRFQDAASVANTIVSERILSPALLDVIEAQLAAGLIADAAATADLFPSTTQQHRGKALVAIARWQIEAGDLAGAQQTIQQARRVAARVKSRHRVALLLAVARGQLKAGLRGKARQSVKEALESSSRKQARISNPIELSTIARHLFLVGLPEDGRRTFAMALQKIESGASRNLNARLAYHFNMAMVEQPPAAEEHFMAVYRFAPHLQYQYRRAIRDIVLEMIEAGFLEETLKLARALEKTERASPQAFAVYELLIDDYLHRGEIDLALEIALAIQVDYIRVDGILAVSDRLAAAGRTDDARAQLLGLRSWLEKYEDSGYFARRYKNTDRLSRVASAQARLGFQDDARSTFQRAYLNARALEPVYDRVSMLIVIARALPQ